MNKKNSNMIYNVTLRDWERMQDLIDRNQNGEGVAAKIKDASKAVARFVAGTILTGGADDTLTRKGVYWSSRFEAFAIRALKLGATKEDIFETLKATTVPENFKETHVTKKSYSGYVGSLDRLIDQLMDKYPVKIERKTIECGGSHHWSWETKYSYSRNGRVWPLNYMLTIEGVKGTEKHPIIVVTNEGGGNYGYDFDCYRIPWNRIKVRIEDIVKELV